MKASWLLLMLLTACSTPRPANQAATFSCPGDALKSEVCVLSEPDRLIAVNTSEQTVAIELRLSHIENVELSYRFPFVEFLAPRSSLVILQYARKRRDSSFALDYDWNWRLAL